MKTKMLMLVLPVLISFFTISVVRGVGFNLNLWGQIELSGVALMSALIISAIEFAFSRRR
jgi:hypothetical protein